MGEGFMAKLMALLGGSGGPTAPPEAPSEAPPWMDPSLAPPGGAGVKPNVMPPPPAAPMDDIGMQVQKLQKQREIMKLLGGTAQPQQ